MYMPSTPFLYFLRIDTILLRRMLRAMTLDQYLIETGQTEAEFASKVGTSQPNVHRMRKGQIPGPALMVAIRDETGGKVQPGDFYGEAA